MKKHITPLLALISLLTCLVRVQVAQSFFVYEDFPLFQEGSLRGDMKMLDAGLEPALSSERGIWEGANHQIVFRNHQPESSVLLLGESDWAEFVLTTDLSFQNGNRAGFLLRYRDHENYYCLSLDKQNGEVVLSRVMDGHESILDREPVMFRLGPNRIYLDAFQDEISVFINDRPALLVKDSQFSFAKGKVAFCAWEAERISFKNPELSYKKQKPTILSHLTDMAVTAGNPVDFPVLVDKVRLSDVSIQAMKLPEGAILSHGSFQWFEPKIGQYEAEFEVRAGAEVERRKIALTVFDRINQAMAMNQFGEANERVARQMVQGSSAPIRMARALDVAPGKSLEQLKRRKSESSSLEDAQSGQEQKSGKERTRGNVDYSRLSSPTVIFGGSTPTVRGIGGPKTPPTQSGDDSSESGGRDDDGSSGNNGDDDSSNDETSDDSNQDSGDADDNPDSSDDLPPALPPSAPMLENAITGQNPGEMEFHWSDEAPSGAKAYRVDISTDPLFNPKFTEDIWTTDLFLKKVFDVPGTYYVRVLAATVAPGGNGELSDYSNVISFHVTEATRGFDILQTLNTVFVFNEIPSSTSVTTEADVAAEGGEALRFHYDVAGQSFTGLAFLNQTEPIHDIAKFKTLHYRLRRGIGAEGPLRFILEFKLKKKTLGNVLISDIADEYTEQSFPLYLDGIAAIDEVTLVAVGDSDQDGIGDLWIDSMYLSEDEYVVPASPEIPAASPRSISDEELLDQMQANMAYYFFRETIGPGFVKDSNKSNISSIAATGFGLAAMAILAERYDASVPHWSRVTPDQARARAHILLGHLLDMQANQELLSDLYGIKGFFYHFVDARGKRVPGSEVSSVDTALLVAGALVAGEYFGGEIQARADLLYENIDWTMFLDRDAKQFFHAWKPERSRGFTIFREGGFLSTTRWNLPTDEVLLISLLAVGNHPQDQDILKAYYGYPREAHSYTFKTGPEAGTTVPVVNSFLGSMFTYFYAHCFFDFKTLGPDKPENIPGAPYPTSVDWWQNSVNAIKANRDFGVLRSKYFPFSLDQGNSWGFSATERPDGRYEGLYGAPPSFQGAGHDGTVAVTMPAAALPFFQQGNQGDLASNPAFQTLDYYDRHFRTSLFGEYGLVASYNNKGEFSSTFLGIDSGSALLMVENFRSGLIWNMLASNERVSYALQLLYRAPINLFDVALENLEGGSRVDALSFGITQQGTAFGLGQQVIKLDYMLSPLTGIDLFTDNLSNPENPYEGQGDAAGLIGMKDASQAVPLRWVVFDVPQPAGYSFEGGFGEGIVQDKSMTGFMELDAINARTIVDGDGMLAPFPTAGRKSSAETAFVYFGVDYRNATPQDYGTQTLTFEVYQRS